VSKEAKAAADKDDLPFEEALERLEGIVETMESGELALEQLLQRFDEGSRLVQQCQKKLTEADLKISKLEQSLQGDVELKPMNLPGEDD
jgi:exodeoxyribonuclease VII small subunit